MKAKLVSFVITSRVIVPDNATEEDIITLAHTKIIDNIRVYLTPECAEDVIDDTECPCGEDDLWDVARRYAYEDEYIAGTPEYDELEAIGEDEMADLNDRLERAYSLHLEYDSERDCFIVKA